jgi:hypothetical protein
MMVSAGGPKGPRASLLAVAAAACLSHTAAAAGDVGILYEVWHSKAATAMATVAEMGGQQLTTELVIQSAGALTLDDVYTKYNLSADIYNVQPESGFYCLYRRRPSTAKPPVPNCPDISEHVRRHAQLLTGAGIDYIAVDVTNWPKVDTDGPTDVAVLRPTEVLFEELLALQAAGVAVPRVAVWPCSPANSTTWQYLLDTLYNNASYDSLVYKQGGKKVRPRVRGRGESPMPRTPPPPWHHELMTIRRAAPRRFRSHRPRRWCSCPRTPPATTPPRKLSSAPTAGATT